MTDKIKRHYVSLEIARKLKELGFPQKIDEDDEDYDYLYSTTMIRFSDEPDNLMSYAGAEIMAYLDDDYQKRHNFETFIAPTYYQSMLWLMEKYNTHVMLSCECNCDSYGNVFGFYYDYDVRQFYTEHENCQTFYGVTGMSTGKADMTFDEALEKGVAMAIDILTKKTETKEEENDVH